MVRILERHESFVQGSYPGCMAGLLHILDYHPWHNVRKLLPHKRRGGRRRRRLDRSPKINARNSGEEYIDTDAEALLVQQHSTEETVRTSGRSRKTRLKLPSEEHHRSRILSFRLNSWLHRTNPVHHLEPSENCCNHTDTNAKIPVIVSQKSSAINATNKSKHGQNAASKDGSDQQLSECVDILEIFKVNKEFFLKILQDPEACRSHFHGLKNSNIKVRLAKSRSFPVASSSQARYVRPSTLKHKQSEVWFFLDGKKSVPRTRARKLEESDMESIRVDDGRKGMRKQTSISSTSSSKGLNSQGWNQIVISRFRYLRHKIKQALKESKREKNGHRTVEEVSHRDTFGRGDLTDGTEMSERLEITIDRDSNEIDGLDEDLRKRRLQRVRRTSSLSESLDRYTQLFENTLGRDTRKYSHSRSVRLLTSEEKLPSHAQKSYRRNLSLPDLDYLSSFLNVAAASQDALRLGMSFQILADHSTTKNRDNQNNESESLRLSIDTDNYELLERSDRCSDIKYSADLSAAENEKGMTWTDNITEDSSEPVRENSACFEEHICLTKYLGDELSQENQETDFESCFSDGLSSPAVFPITEGLELDFKCTQTDEPNSYTLRQDRSTNLFTENEGLNYVRHVLALSGFIGDDEAPTWHSIDQPLSPELFKQLEDCFDCYEDEITGSYDDDHHRLLFDLVNETLVDMNEKSYTYFPRPFSRPMPKGNRLLEDVWTRTNSHLSLRPEMDKSLDDVLARDLAKRDGWMNLEWEREMVALELEDLIFDQLLDEVLCS